MHNAHVSTTSAVDGPKVVARFDLSESEIAAVARAVDVSRTEQFRHQELSTDDVVAMRELTALADQLTALAGYGSAVSVELSPARLVALRDTLHVFVEMRDEAGFTRDEDRDAYAVSLALAAPLADLSADALRAAPGSPGAGARPASGSRRPPAAPPPAPRGAPRRPAPGPAGPGGCGGAPRPAPVAGAAAAGRRACTSWRAGRRPPGRPGRWC